MLEFELRNGDNGDRQWFRAWFVDAHTHLGKEEIITAKGKNVRQNTIREILDLYIKISLKLSSLSSNDSPWKIREYSFFDVKGKTSTNAYQSLKRTLSVAPVLDAFVTFPFSDILRNKTVPAFVRSNNFILSRCYNGENSLLTIPYCRVDPKDQEKACMEIVRAQRLGARGLKLHPISQGFSDKVNSEEVRQILVQAGKMGLPVIFDTANANIAMDIAEVSAEAQRILNGLDGMHLKVILGHLGFDYGNEKVVSLLKLPFIFGETSGCRGKDVPVLFRTLNKVFTNFSWGEKLLYGTDANYFGQIQAIDFLKYLFSALWWTNHEGPPSTGIISVISNVIGRNQLRITPASFRTSAKGKAEIDQEADTWADGSMVSAIEHIQTAIKTKGIIPIRIHHQNDSPLEISLKGLREIPSFDLGWGDVEGFKLGEISLFENTFKVFRANDGCYLKKITINPKIAENTDSSTQENNEGGSFFK